MNNINISPKKKKLIVYIILTIVTLAVFWQVNGYEFINFDDNGYIMENRHIQSGMTLDGLRWAFGTRYLDLWNPLIWLSFMFDYQLHGLNAGGYHLTNLILHILSALLLFWLFNRMTGEIWKSAFVAAFFALHPLHVESVAWIAERKDVLSAFFWMLTLCLYVYYTEKPAIKRYLLVLFCFICALMSKPMVVTLPLIMILLDYWPLGRFELQKGKTNLILWQLKEKLPFFVLSAVLIFITLYTPNNDISAKGFPLSSRLANAPVSFVTYLAKTFWPQDLAIFYPFPNQIPLGQVVAASLLTIFISAFVIAMIKCLPYLFVGWSWFAITIAPVIGILQISLTVPYAMADRYHYLPSIGIAMMLAWGIPSLLKNEDTRKNILFPAAIVCLALMSVLTWQQCRYWKNSAILFNHALRVTNDNYMAHTNFAVALAEKGRLNEAIHHYNKAIIIAPDRALPYYNRGTSYGRAGQYHFAIEDFNNAIRLDRNYIKAYNNRGIAYTKLGLYQMALIDFNKAISLQEDYADAYNNRAFVYLNQGDNISGCSDAKKACELGNCKALEFAKSKGLCR
jgi:tetratricopeptide (TPR) repeat protein